MNYDFYKTFVLLAETNNFSKAAEKLNIVQSTVSNRIQELEKYLGTDLFSRTNKTVTLTQAGLNFLSYAKRIVAIEEEGLSMIDKLNYKDTLKIGTVHSLYSGYIKNAAKKFMKLKPNTSLEIIINHTPNLLEMLSDNLIDIGFVFTLPKSNKFICSNILKDEIILVTKNSNEFKNELNIEELKNITLLYADTGDIFITYVEDQIHSKLDFQLSIDQILEIVEYLREGFGYAFVPKSLVADSIQKGYLKEVKIKNTMPCTIEGYVVVEKNKIKKEAVDCFIELISEEVSDSEGAV
jgi:DNA-binding transcriptional LysR family regulator